MTTPLRRRIRHTRRFVGYGLLVVLILAAVAVGLLNQLLPLVEQHPRKIAGWLGERIGQPVSFTRATGVWTRRGPRFTLDGLRIGEGARSLDIGRAELLVAVYAGLLPGEPLTELKVRDLSLVLEQGEDGRWHMVGLPFEPRPGIDPLDTLEALGELQVERAHLAIRSPAFARDLLLPRVDLRLRVDGDVLRAGVRAYAQTRGTPLNAVVDLDREGWSGRLWAGGEDLQLGEWSALLADTGLVLAGAGSLDLWARIDAQRVADVRSRASFSPLALGARQPWLAPADEDGAIAPDVVLQSPPVAYERADLLVRWQRDAEGWQLHAPLLHFHETGRREPRSFDGLWIAGGERYALQAPRMDLGPAQALAKLSPALPMGLRRWLHEASPEGSLVDVQVQGDEHRLSGSARFNAVGWRPHAMNPGLGGLSGVASFDEQGGVVRLGETPVRLDWPRLRQPLELRLAGTLGWWRDHDGWAAGASGLRIRGEDFGALVRGEMTFQREGRRPRLDLAAEVDPSSLQAAKKFWIVGKMPPRTLEWLDGALEEGKVEMARLVLSGDLDDWPFREGEGRLDARARVVEGRVQFNPDWPPAESLDLDVSFDGPGMAIEGSAVILGNRVSRLSGGVADFANPRLLLEIDASTRGESLQALMIASPLRQRYEEHLLNARVSGPAQVALTLDLPLTERLGGRRIEGSIELAQAQLSDPRWDIDFTEVDGQVRFSDQGFEAPELAVLFEGEPARLSLAVGEAFTDDLGLAARAQLAGRFAPQVLLARQETLAWLEPWMSGDSDWTVSLEVPRSPPDAATAPSVLQLESDLVGTAITLPAPLGKPADEPLALSLQTPLPLAGGEIRLRLGELLRLRGRMDGDRGMTGLIQLGPGPEARVPAQGLSVRGRADTLDAAGWIGFATQGEGGGTGDLAELDVQVASLDLLGSAFTDTRIQLRREATLTRLQLSGQSVLGSVDIPADRTLGIDGRFERLHWPQKPSSAPGPEASPATAAIAQGDLTLEPDAEADDGQDPGSLPPLRFTVQDLRVGELELGQAELTTQPVPQGMRVEQFTTRSESLQLSANGDWLRAGPGRSQSRFQVGFNARSLGELLSAFGLAGMVQDAPIQGSFDGRWPGSPGGFALARFEGRLRVDVGEGQLLEVEPGGGGRVLGLISLAEIPRRLSLDFSDFFSRGFGFNTMSGEFVFADGRASTDLLQINGPAAEIRVSGSTDLRRQQYDQRIEVLPKAGGALPVIGAIAGGPVGAAVGAVAQAVLQKPLKEAARTVYQVSGPWKEPEVEVIERGPSPASREARTPASP